MKRFILTIISIILVGFGTNVQADAKEKKLDETAYVDVSVATLWTAPNILRPVDEPSAANPVNMRKWTSAMTLEQQLQLSADGMLETQALYGNKVTILERQGEWVKVAVAGQPTPRNDLGYPGWMPASQLTYSKKFAKAENQPFIMITEPTTFLYPSPSFKEKNLEISYNTLLPYEGETKNAYKVLKPNGKKAFVKKEHAKLFSSIAEIPAPTGEKLVETGKKFLGLHYLWAGMSGFGFDCSGFTFTMYQSYGITIPRDSSVQAKNGVSVELDDLQSGDLLFFAHDNGKGSVHHVAMYAGNGMMIHSPNSKKNVEIIPVDTKGYIEELSGARRYLP
ncbi:peptidase P60 [Peribacillus muralis]|uniref:Peptidase P60 n=1 Tax=Peribacillus muralis TaxID=264697 RepID=A0A1B3XIJ3_9BACI|nr:C40 family peptidase [Peribacillus muralis]AOH53036.1 peptidase P60 [Peribacillus muralis]